MSKYRTFKRGNFSIMNNVDTLAESSVSKMSGFEYFTIKNIYLDKEGLPCDFKLGKLISDTSVYGLVYDVFCGDFMETDESKYILKRIIYKSDSPIYSNIKPVMFIKKLENEFSIQEKASIAGICDKIVLAYKLMPKNYLIPRAITTIEGGFVMRKYKSTLFEQLVNLPSLDIGVGLIAQALELIKKLLCCQIVHKDLHSGNFMIDETGSLKIIDFGLAKNFGISPEYFKKSDVDDILEKSKYIDDKDIIDVRDFNFFRDVIGTSQIIYSPLYDLDNFHMTLQRITSRISGLDSAIDPLIFKTRKEIMQIATVIYLERTKPLRRNNMNNN